MDRAALAVFLRRRRAALQPADLGLPPGARRRTPGLRREEVAGVTGMSVDYYNRLERGQSPQPSPQILAALARTLRLSRDERDYLFRVAGHQPPADHTSLAHVRPGLLHLLDQLTGTPALVTTDLGGVLAQNALAVMLLGDLRRGCGPAGSFIHRWFVDAQIRSLVPEADHGRLGEALVADLRAAVARRGNDSAAADIVDRLQQSSAEFLALWDRHDVAVQRGTSKRVAHPVVGILDLDVEVLISEGQDQRLLTFTAPPGSESAQKLRLLNVVGNQDLTVPERI